ncbi:MAG: hypothetical protein NZO58_06950 [Gemmataceae bacterium]|nr:hypothetical protein [Gemmataceae bacterium]
MVRQLFVGGLLLAALAAAGGVGQSQERDPRKGANVVAATPKDYETLRRLGQINGIIVAANAKTLTFRIDTPRIQPKVAPKGKRPNPQALLVHDYVEYEVNVSDKVVVHKRFVTADFDDKGNLTKNEAQEKELKKNGFIVISVNDIKPGNIGTLTFAPGKAEGKQEGVGNLAKPVVTKIILTQEGKAPEPAAKGLEKKKKN